MAYLTSLTTCICSMFVVCLKGDLLLLKARFLKAVMQSAGQIRCHNLGIWDNYCNHLTFDVASVLPPSSQQATWTIYYLLIKKKNKTQTFCPHQINSALGFRFIIVAVKLESLWWYNKSKSCCFIYEAAEAREGLAGGWIWRPNYLCWHHYYNLISPYLDNVLKFH